MFGPACAGHASHATGPLRGVPASLTPGLSVLLPIPYASGEAHDRWYHHGPGGYRPGTFAPSRCRRDAPGARPGRSTSGASSGKAAALAGMSRWEWVELPGARKKRSSTTGMTHRSLRSPRQSDRFLPCKAPVFWMHPDERATAVVMIPMRRGCEPVVFVFWFTSGAKTHLL